MRDLFSFEFEFALIYQMLILEFSLKRQLCVCMNMYTLFKSVRSMISKSLLEEPVVLDKLDILFLQCVKGPRGAQMCPSILRALVAFLCQYSSGTSKKIWA